MRELPALTVSELTAAVKELLEECFPDVAVTGEISNLVRARSGHVYLTLKDGGATLSAVIWRSRAERLGHEPEEGMEVLARGELNLYPPRGQYQLVVRSLAPRGIGSLMAAVEKLRAKLREEGLFSEERKRPIPFLPRVVGVVTSPTGAAIRDILNVLARRGPGVSALLLPVRVQGEGAAEEVAAAIGVLGAREDVDLLIVGRGGGSLEDLMAFNQEVVARAIAACPVPVISAVGHESDVTTSDLVADLRAPTPSAAAELAVPSEADLRRTLARAGTRLERAGERMVRERRARLDGLLSSYGFRRLPDRLREHAQRLDDLAGRTARAAGAVVTDARRALCELSGRIEALSPLRVLARGYSVTTREEDRAPLGSAAGAAVGDRIRTRLARGSLLSRVEAVEGEDG